MSLLEWKDLTGPNCISNSSSDGTADIGRDEDKNDEMRIGYSR
jgi:hypothetical protein